MYRQYIYIHTIFTYYIYINKNKIILIVHFIYNIQFVYIYIYLYIHTLCVCVQNIQICIWFPGQVSCGASLGHLCRANAALWQGHADWDGSWPDTEVTNATMRCQPWGYHWEIINHTHTYIYTCA